MAENRLVRCVTPSVLVLGLIACGGDEKPANTGLPGATQCPPGQYFDGQMCQTPGAAVQPTQAPAAVATAPAVTAPPAAPILATSAPGTPAQPLDATSLSAVTQLLTPLAAQHAPGAKPVGSAFGGNFQQGQIIEGQVQMNPGKSYAVIGAGMPTIQNLDIELVPLAPIAGLPSPILAADSTQAPTAVVGGAPNFFKWAWPVGAPVKVILRVSAGQGMAGAQVYEK